MDLVRGAFLRFDDYSLGGVATWIAEGKRWTRCGKRCVANAGGGGQATVPGRLVTRPVVDNDWQASSSRPGRRYTGALTGARAPARG